MAHVDKFIFIDDGVDCNVDLGMKLMGVVAEGLDVIERIADGGTGAKLRRADIYGIGSMVDGGQTTRKILGRSEKFYGSHYYLMSLML